MGLWRKYQEDYCSSGVALSIGVLGGGGLLFLRFIGIFENVSKPHFGHFSHF